MPLEHTRTYRVRYYECDAYGHLNNANYLRYMQETAFDASAAAGYDLQRYEQMQRVWLVRETEIEFLRPLVYNDCVNVKTWIIDFRRVTSRRAYEFRLSGSGEMAASAITDWAFINTENLRPARIPSSLQNDFFPEGPPSDQQPRPQTPVIPPPPLAAFRMHRTVSWLDLDQMNHVNNAIYLEYASDCSFLALAAFNWPYARMQAEGFGIFLRRLNIQYLQPALQDDDLEITTWVSGVRRSMATRHYTIDRSSDGVRLAQIRTLGVWVNLKTGQPVRIPAAMLADMSPMIVTK